MVASRAPQEQTDALRLQAVDEARAGGDADDGDEDVEADRVHEPDGGRRDASEGRAHRAQPATDDPGDQRAAGGRQRERHAGHLEDQRADQRADHDRRADERHVGDVGRTIRDAQHLGDGGGVLRAADDGEQVAAIDLGARQDGNIGGGRAARDLAQEDAARRRARRQLGERLAVDRPCSSPGRRRPPPARRAARGRRLRPRSAAPSPALRARPRPPPRRPPSGRCPRSHP